ncbi:hypothetical protein [Actinomadura napierensis]
MPDNTEPGRPAAPNPVSARRCRAERVATWALAAIAAVAALGALAVVLASSIPRRRGTRHLPRTRVRRRRTGDQAVATRSR